MLDEDRCLAGVGDHPKWTIAITDGPRCRWRMGTLVIQSVSFDSGPTVPACSPNKRGERFRGESIRPGRTAIRAARGRGLGNQVESLLCEVPVECEDSRYPEAPHSFEACTIHQAQRSATRRQ